MFNIWTGWFNDEALTALTNLLGGHEMWANIVVLLAVILILVICSKVEKYDTSGAQYRKNQPYSDFMVFYSDIDKGV